MRPPRLATLALSAVFVGSACLGASAHRNINTQSKSDDVRRCSDLSIEFDDEPAVTAEETLTAPAGSGNVLTVRPPQNGGVYVAGARSPRLRGHDLQGRRAGRGARARSSTPCTRPSTAGPSRRPASSNDDSVVFYIVEAPLAGRST